MYRYSQQPGIKREFEKYAGNIIHFNDRVKYGKPIIL